MPKSELPEAEFVRASYTIRAMDLPPNVKLTKRSMLRWFALACGLISERESRSTILDVLDAFLYFQITKRAKPTTADIQLYLKSRNVQISEKLLRYHIKRLITMNIIKRKNLRYTFAQAPHADQDNLCEGFAHNFSGSISSALKEIENGLERLIQNYQ